MEARTERPKTLLWAGAAVTASAAIFFPRVEGIRDRDESWWRLAWFFVPQDLEGVVLAPVVVLLTIALFALVGRWAWQDDEGRNRPAKVGFGSSLLGLAGVLAFWLSAPIIFGGLGATLGMEGRRRMVTEGRGTSRPPRSAWAPSRSRSAQPYGCSGKSFRSRRGESGTIEKEGRVAIRTPDERLGARHSADRSQPLAPKPLRPVD